MIAKEKKVEVFQNFLDTFETDEVKNFCMDVIGQLEDYLFTCPSSSTGKYHSKQQCETHGQLIHILMACEIMKYVLEIKYVRDGYSPIERDSLRAAILFHDAKKYGNHEGNGTVHEHPILAADWIKDIKVQHDVGDIVRKYIARLISTHSGEWTTSEHSDVVLPQLERDDQFLVHLCDYLASRKNLIFDYGSDLDFMFKKFLIKNDMAIKTVPTVYQLRAITKDELPKRIDEILSGAVAHIIEKCKEKASLGEGKYTIYWNHIPVEGKKYAIQKICDIISEFEDKGYNVEFIDTSDTDSVYSELAVSFYWGEQYSKYTENPNFIYSIYTTTYGFNHEYSDKRHCELDDIEKRTVTGVNCYVK